MNIIIDETTSTVKLKGDLDISTSPSFSEEILDFYKTNKSDLVFDLSALDYIDSTGLGAFIKIYKTLEDDGYKIKVIKAKPNVGKIFAITEMDKVFEIEADNE